MNIIINGRPKEIGAYRKLSYDNLVVREYGPTPTDSVMTITYSHGPAKNPQGSVTPGQSVILKKDMRFTIIRTDKA